MEPVDLRRAVEIAVAYMAEIIGTNPQEVLLEEVEKTKQQEASYWLITLSFPRRVPSTEVGSAFARMASISLGNREYKVLTVDAGTGEVVSIKIRDTSILSTAH